MTATQPAPDPMKVLDDSAAAVQTFTGIKAMYVAAGWHERNAERMVIQMFAHATLQQSPGPTP